MAQASSFIPLAPAGAAPVAGSRRASLFAALDGAAFTIPLSLGSVTLVFSKIGGDVMASAIITTLLAIAVLQLTTANARRPLLFSARFFEATTLAAMMDRAVELMPHWGVSDTPQVRLALLCVVVGAAGVVVGLLYVARADRFSRHIPTPVFAAFSNSIAFGLLLSQAGTLHHLVAGKGLAAAALLAGAAFAIGIGIRRWLPRWPAAACALATGLALGAALLVSGMPVVMLGSAGSSIALPGASADFHALAASKSLPLAAWLGTNSAILGTMMFINTSITAQAVSHADDRPRETTGRLLWTSAWLAIAGAAGGAPLSASLQSANAAMRHAALSSTVLLSSAAVIAFVAATGLLAMVPLAAVAGALVCEAVFMVDRPTIRLLRGWATRHRLSGQQREDLWLVMLVTATAVFFNMVAAVLAGLLLGLLMFASRHLTPPVRALWDGLQVSSNCARSRRDVTLLAQHGREIRVFELQGDIFFGTVDALDAALRSALHGARCVVLDWSAVRNVDTTAVQACTKFARTAREAGVMLVHVDPAASSPEVAAALRAATAGGVVAPDLDRALEHAENHVLHAHGEVHGTTDTTTMLETMSLFAGLDEDERAAMEAAMTQRVVHAGETVTARGEASNELMIVLQGSASVLVPDSDGHTVRVAGLRRGALIGEIAFLDSAPRSATVVANEQMLLAVLDRASYERLSASPIHAWCKGCSRTSPCTWRRGCATRPRSPRRGSTGDPTPEPCALGCPAVPTGTDSALLRIPTFAPLAAS